MLEAEIISSILSLATQLEPELYNAISDIIRQKRPELTQNEPPANGEAELLADADAQIKAKFPGA